MPFDVIEIEISPPHHVRVLARDKDGNSAEAVIAMAIARGGVETHCYAKCEPGRYQDGDTIRFFEERKHGETVDFFNEIARKKLGIGPEWRWCILKSVGDTRDSLVTLGVPRILTKGKHKGKSTFKNVPLKECVVIDDEVKTARASYERDTGKCSECYGKGKEFASWDHIGGYTYRECRRCKGNGKAQ